MSPAACSSSVRPRRTTSWSSRRKTRIIASYCFARGNPRAEGPDYHRAMASDAGTDQGEQQRDPPSLGLTALSRIRLDELLQEMLDRVGEVVASRERLRALLNAVVAVGSDLDLRSMLERIVVAGCELVGARYGA